MVASIGLCAVALRRGLALRRTRLKRRRRTRESLRAHLRIAKPAVLLVAVGFLAGPLSAAWLRDWTPLSTFHAWIGITSFGLFVAAAAIGRNLERGRGRAVEAHAITAGLAVLAAAVAAIAGFVLLP